MKLQAEAEANIETEDISQLRELDRLNAEVAVLRDCNTALARERDETAWRSDVARRSERK